MRQSQLWFCLHKANICSCWFRFFFVYLPWVYVPREDILFAQAYTTTFLSKLEIALPCQHSGCTFIFGCFEDKNIHSKCETMKYERIALASILLWPNRLHISVHMEFLPYKLFSFIFFRSVSIRLTLNLFCSLKFPFKPIIFKTLHNTHLRCISQKFTTSTNSNWNGKIRFSTIFFKFISVLFLQNVVCTDSVHNTRKPHWLT